MLSFAQTSLSTLSRRAAPYLRLATATPPKLPLSPLSGVAYFSTQDRIELGLPRTGPLTSRQVQSAFNKQALKKHPDVSTSPTAHTDFIALTRAKESLEREIKGGSMSGEGIEDCTVESTGVKGTLQSILEDLFFDFAGNKKEEVRQWLINCTLDPHNIIKNAPLHKKEELLRVLMKYNDAEIITLFLSIDKSCLRNSQVTLNHALLEGQLEAAKILIKEGSPIDKDSLTVLRRFGYYREDKVSKFLTLKVSRRSLEYCLAEIAKVCPIDEAQKARIIKDIAPNRP